MKFLYRTLVVLLIATLLMPNISFAGNKDRQGQAGGAELMINPWPRSSGWGNANMASVKGIEALWGNVAGAAFTKRTQLQFAYTDWMKGTGTNIIAFGLTQKVGEAGALGLQVMSMNFGEVEITTTNSPDGGVGTYKPNLMNFSISYSKAFSNSIYAGVLVKLISESIADINGFGIALDIGIQYVTGENDQMAFGIALKNLGPKMSFSGDGLSIRSLLPGQSTLFTTEQRSMPFELPAQLNIGASYAFLMPAENKITLAGNFTSNSFSRDQFVLGLEYSFKEIFVIRAAYTYENGMWDDIYTPQNTNVNNGLSAGISLALPLNKEKGTYIGIDYAFRQTVVFNNNHTLGLIFNF
ncbi:MAG TPA: PorV/PorQ family protein [Bacteroidetes bacterium]|nr:PorV/PorQ family protein [Bacteroidota bacterium]